MNERKTNEYHATNKGCLFPTNDVILTRSFLGLRMSNITISERASLKHYDNHFSCIKL